MHFVIFCYIILIKLVNRYEDLAYGYINGYILWNPCLIYDIQMSFTNELSSNGINYAYHSQIPLNMSHSGIIPM